MKPGDLWICPVCQVEIQCDIWGIRHSAPGHSINFRKEYAREHEKTPQLGFDQKTYPQKKGEQGTLF